MSAVPYRFATDDRSYADLASGHVLRSRPGQPAFPARLAREMFEQALALRPPGPAVVYDPCCGAGHLLATVGLLSADRLAAVIGSDVDGPALALARENLRLLEAGGLAARVAELEALHRQHGNPAHRGALDSARALAAAQAVTLPVRTFQADALDSRAVLDGLGDARPDIVLADVPYGRMSAWQGHPPNEGAAALLAAFSRVLRPGAVLAIASSGDLKVAGDHFHRRRQLKLGKRRVTWLIRDARSAAAP